MNGYFCLFALFALHHQHLCTISIYAPSASMHVSVLWATYSKQLTGHEFCIVCARKWLVCSPLGGGGGGGIW